MKKFFSSNVFLSAILLLSFSGAYAKEQDKDEIVVVDLARVAESDSFKKERDSIEKDIKAKAQVIEDLENKMNKTLSELRNKARDMSASALEKAQEDMARLQAELEVKKRNLQAHVQRVSSEIETKLVAQVKEICKSKGWKIVVPMALYADASVDKTADVIAVLNKQSATATKRS